MASALWLLYHYPLAVYPSDQLLHRLERKGAVPDELGREVDAVPPPRRVDLHLGLGGHRMFVGRFVL